MSLGQTSRRHLRFGVLRTDLLRLLTFAVSDRESIDLDAKSSYIDAFERCNLVNCKLWSHAEGWAGVPINLLLHWQLQSGSQLTLSRAIAPVRLRAPQRLCILTSRPRSSTMTLERCQRHNFP